MIVVPRTLGAPDALTRPSTREPRLTETEGVIAAAEALLQQAGVDPDAASVEDVVTALAPLSFAFRKYSHDEVKAALTTLFNGKCAYCESRYAGTQPMDVEHFRPKAQVLDEASGVELKPGYYWLAASWDNLLPSCIDCNRRRRHGEHQTVGKADRFPLQAGSPRVRWHGEDPEGTCTAERPLILNPCLDTDPDQHLRFTVDGEVVGLTDRGRATIEVYGLMRPGLVIDRREVARVLEFRLDLVARMQQLRARLAALDEYERDPALMVLVEEVVVLLLRELEAMTAADRPFAGMVRQLLGDLLAQPPGDPQVPTDDHQPASTGAP